tara:strand:- start:1293 stop:1760 length:468 start_codon:yes stop_codon:yes gene_type:complete
MAEKNHYVNNEEFLIEMTEYRNDYLKYVDSHKTLTKPKISESVALSFIKIATNLSNKANFRNYTYKDEMILDGIENCVAYAHNFNPEKSTNPFSYFTQIIYYAFVRRIQKENKQTDIKRSLIRNLDITELINLKETEDIPEVREYFEIIKDYFEK